MSHTWPFFNAQFPTAEGGSCADQMRLANGQMGETHDSPNLTGSPIGSSTNLTSQQHRKLSLQVNHSKSFDRSENPRMQSVAQKGYRTFLPGDYIYNFELPLDSRLPETIDVDLGSVRYELEAIVERAGAFRGNLVGSKEILLIRAPSEGSLEQTEPIAISRSWEDQLHYDIVISGKSFPLGAKIPIAFKLTPLAKVQCHRIKVYVTENTEYFCSQKRVHRMEPTRKILLFEKRADGHSTSTFPGSTIRVTAGGGVPYDQRVAAANGEEVAIQDTANLLGVLEGRDNVGPTEMEFSVQLPGCHHNSERERINRLHFDTTYQNIQVHHWIKVFIVFTKSSSSFTNVTRSSCVFQNLTKMIHPSADISKFLSTHHSTSSLVVLIKPTPPCRLIQARTLVTEPRRCLIADALELLVVASLRHRSLHLTHSLLLVTMNGQEATLVYRQVLHGRNKYTLVAMQLCNGLSTCSEHLHSTHLHSRMWNHHHH